jgi:hypothetical protein
MWKIIPFVLLAMFFLKGAVNVHSLIKFRGFEELTIQEMENRNLSELNYVRITGGMCLPSVTRSFENTDIVWDRSFPLLNPDSLYHHKFTKKTRSKVIVQQTGRQDFQEGEILVQGRVKLTRLKENDLKLLSKVAVLEEGYIVIQNGWEKPSYLWTLLLILLPGFLLVKLIKMK